MWAALQPDGELSQFERRILEVHLARCADCARHAARVAAIVAVVRDTPSESMPSPVGVVRRPRPGWGTIRTLAVGGGVAATLAGIAFSTLLTLDRTARPAAPTPPLIVVSSAQDGPDEAQLWRETRKAERVAAERVYSTQSRGAVFPLG
jgi:anti-sigma factor RsiW